VAAWTFLLYGVRISVLRLLAGMDPRVGSLVGCTIFFFAPLAALATVGPFVVKLLTKEIGHLGGQMGKVTAVSTIGSLLGAVLTGYVFIPVFGVGNSLLMVACLLLALSLIGTFASKHAGVGMLVLVLSTLAGGAGVSLESGINSFPGKGLIILEERSSNYAELKVLEDRQMEDWGPMKVMFIGHGPHTILYDRGEPEAIANQPQYWHAVPLMRYIRPTMKRVLVIGLGGGKIVADLVADPKGPEKIDVVEIDADVAELAQKYFGFKPEGKVRLFVQDARAFVQRTESRYDLIIMDAFGAGTAPFHLFSAEALAEMKQVLAPGGLFFMNYLGFGHGPNRQAMDSVLRTTKEVFDHWRVFAGQRPVRKRGYWANYLVLASMEDLGFRENPFDLRTGIPGIEGIRARWLVQVNRELSQMTAEQRQDTPDIIPKGIEPPFIEMLAEDIDRSLDLSAQFDPEGGELVTDDRNPLEPWNEVQNRTLREIVWKELGYQKVFLGSE
jgi:predicted membrane-bound spermidine synthase